MQYACVLNGFSGDQAIFKLAKCIFIALSHSYLW